MIEGGIDAGSLTLADSNDVIDAAASDGIVVFWSGLDVPANTISLIRYCEEHGERLKKRYCEWVGDLGNETIAGSPISKHFAIRSGETLWWLNLLVERDVGKSPEIPSVLRLIALSEIVTSNNIDRLRLITSNSRLKRTLSEWCRSRGIQYTVAYKPVLKRENSGVLRRVHAWMPVWLRGLVTIAHYAVMHWPLRSIRNLRWFGGKDAVFICSYFIHLDARECDAGRFWSNQWGGLPHAMHAAGYRINWIQHYLKSSAVPDASIANRWVAAFNRRPKQTELHAFLDAFLTVNVVLWVVRQWICAVLRALRLRTAPTVFYFGELKVPFWHFLADDWKSSLYGPAAVQNLLWMRLFDDALASLPRQKLGLYLCENQAWERALIYAWRRNGHGRLIAVPHSTRSFWDLRFFRDGRPSADPNLACPEPDLVAVNGPAALRMLLSENYPADRLQVCEALRYSHLGRAPRQLTSAEPHSDCRMLVLGDYDKTTTDRMLSVLADALREAGAVASVVIKPHPNYSVNGAESDIPNVRVVEAPIAQIIHDFDVAYCSNFTSAAVDAYVCGVEVIVMLDDSTLNFSPLRNLPGVRFVRNAKDLASALHGERANHNQLKGEAFFCLQPGFERWLDLLKAQSAVN